MKLGFMTEPDSFRYRDVAEKGPPLHGKDDIFTMKHPPMPPEHWAKIFAPFDALKGFDEAIQEKEAESVQEEIERISLE